MVLNRVAVTGASGMVGRHLLPLLAARGIAAAATSRSRPQRVTEDSAWASWDLTEWRTPAELDVLFGPVDALFHLGASVPTAGKKLDDANLINANVRACRCLANWAVARGVPLIFLSGAIVYGPGRDAFAETAPRSTVPEAGLYGLSKVLAEQVLENLVPAGLKLSCLRATSIYGAGMDDVKMMPTMLRRAQAGETIMIEPPYDDMINLVHAADVARAMMLAAEREAGGVFNVAGPELVAIRAIADACVAAAGTGKVVIADASTDVRPPIVRYNVEARRAEEILGFVPEIGLIDGLTRMLSNRLT